jgi:hypothetical protein
MLRELRRKQHRQGFREKRHEGGQLSKTAVFWALTQRKIAKQVPTAEILCPEDGSNTILRNTGNYSKLIMLYICILSQLFHFHFLEHDWKKTAIFLKTTINT